MSTETMYWVRCTASDGAVDYCLKWGPASPRWEGTRASASERAAMMTATSPTGAVYTIEEAIPTEADLRLMDIHAEESRVVRIADVLSGGANDEH